MKGYFVGTESIKSRFSSEWAQNEQNDQPQWNRSLSTSGIALGRHRRVITCYIV